MDENIKVDKFTIFGYPNSAAEAYAEDNEIEFVSLSPRSSNTQTDSNSGITVSANPQDTAKAELVVTKIVDKESIEDVKPSLNGESLVNLYDISLDNNNEAVQPSGQAMVKIPCKNKNAKVYRVEEDGSLTDMNARYVEDGGYLLFYTDHFSKYAIAADVVIGDVDSNNDITIADAIMVQKHIVNIFKLTGDQITAADVDGNGEITIADAIMIQKHIVQILTIA